MTSYAMGVDATAKDSPKPYRHAMKYSARSCTPPDGRPTDMTDDDYLRRGLAEHLDQADGCFEFLVQLQDPQREHADRGSHGALEGVAVAVRPRGRHPHPGGRSSTRPARNTFCENLRSRRGTRTRTTAHSAA